MSPLRRFFFNDTSTTEIYTLSLHDALPISRPCERNEEVLRLHLKVLHQDQRPAEPRDVRQQDRKSTRLNSSHGYISYAVFCLKKKIMTYTRSATIRRASSRGLSFASIPRHI